MPNKYHRVAEAIEKIARGHSVKSLADLQELFPDCIISSTGLSEASVVDSSDATYKKLGYTCEKIEIEGKSYWVIVNAATWNDHLGEFKGYARRNPHKLYTPQDIADIQSI